MPLETFAWDVSRYLRTEADQASYIRTALEDGDAVDILGALMRVADVRGLQELSRQTGALLDSAIAASDAHRLQGWNELSLEQLRMFLMQLDLRLTSKMPDLDSQLQTEAA